MGVGQLVAAKTSDAKRPFLAHASPVRQEQPGFDRVLGSERFEHRCLEDALVPVCEHSFTLEKKMMALVQIGGFGFEALVLEWETTDTPQSKPRGKLIDRCPLGSFSK